MDFPIEVIRKVFPNATLEKCIIIASQGEFFRKHFLWCYGEVLPCEYPEEAKEIQEALGKWARSEGLA